jgi:CDP-paratose 2-epimerase
MTPKDIDNDPRHEGPVLDYSRTYRIPTVVFRMSCIHSPHQFGNEDEGLFVEDLVDAWLFAEQDVTRLSGHAFNVGGVPPVDFEGWRRGDQRYYVSDIRKFHVATGWTPQVGVREGVTRLYSWRLESHGLASRPQPTPVEMPRRELAGVRDQ